MFVDMKGKVRQKLALHQHTRRSDGRRTPEEVAALYAAAGYDAVAFTDHYVYGHADVIDGMPILAGAEYHKGHRDAKEGIFHILCLFADKEPNITREMQLGPQAMIDAIHEAGGIAVLAHPAWSMNTPEVIASLRGVDATEIFNTGSDVGMNHRGDSSLIVDMLASDGIYFPLIATDDSHRYGVGDIMDHCTSAVMVECDSLDPKALKKAILEKRFYATTGPEIHLSRLADGGFAVDCSPATEIVFTSNSVYMPDRILRGEGLTHGEYHPNTEIERYIRAYVTDSNGKRAWSNIIEL